MTETDGGQARQEMPEALKDLIKAARKELMAVGDDGTSATSRKIVTVRIGWRELRSIYNQHRYLESARASRDRLRAKLREKPSRNDEGIRVLDSTHTRLLKDIERILEGTETSDRAVQQALSRLKKLLTR